MAYDRESSYLKVYDSNTVYGISMEKLYSTSQVITYNSLSTYPNANIYHNTKIAQTKKF